MAKPNEEVLRLARSTSDRLAGGALPPTFAKLYSQHTRLGAGRPGLRMWRSTEAEERLEDAVRLVEVALIQRSSDQANWTDAMLRAAEVLEWLSHPTLNPDGLPMRLLAAAAYQLAGYPARATGILNLATEFAAEAGPLRALLGGDFPGLLRLLTRHWSLGPRRPGEATDFNWSDDELSAAQLRKLVEDETASALGLLSANLRWGSNERVDAALDKLTTVAKFMLNGRDRYSWLLAKLVAETGRTFVTTSLRECLAWLPAQLDESGGLAVERYFRQSYQSCRTQAWPSQRRGIERLKEGNSFVLCTPTGSGKTTVAEIAILQRLFSPVAAEPVPVAPLVMYLVPKRALAAEVEAKLLRTIAPLSNERLVITGLYGGIDWGPTDAWLTSDERTVLICTYEKAEALIRFLGPLFLGRLSLVVLDEAHMVQFDGKDQDLRSAESRALRLESLVARILVHIPATQNQVIALSAVAAGMEGTLARWITGNVSATPARILYRSTRQLIGSLECRANRSFEIRYDLLDRASLRFDEAGEGGTPFIPEPFPPFPPAPSFEPTPSSPVGPEKRLRPYLFWAAMHLVAPTQSGKMHAVLISIPQKIGGYAEDFLTLLEEDWADVKLPEFFRPPTDAAKRDKWQRCLLACEDYFGRDSREYRLLEKGVVVHHGKMPGIMARLLVQLVDEGVMHLIVATSTLSEGVNLPFEVVLLPTLRRSNDWITPQEFANLAGRAGRPGHGTEGRSLVLLPAAPRNWSAEQAANKYAELIQKLRVTPEPATSERGGRSALAALLVSLRANWQMASKSTSDEAFLRWLEATATLNVAASATAPPDSLMETLDSLDSILLAAIVEIESLTSATLTPTELEGQLAAIWRRCYAYYASDQEAMLGTWFRRRGQALSTRIYPDADQRRRLYRSGLPPRLGSRLMDLYPSVRQHLLTGVDYATRDSEGRFQFIRDLVNLLATHPRFALDPKRPGKVPWENILRWWLDPKGPVAPPSAKRVSDWYDYVATNFGYRFAWGVGCMLALAADEAHKGMLQPTTLESWDAMGLPWISLWLKELIVWGNLDPVVAYLLGRGRAGTRTEASTLADRYFQEHQTLAPNDQLDPATIRGWAEALTRPTAADSRTRPTSPMKVTLERVFPRDVPRRWHVLPGEAGDRIQWLDPAGYVLAQGTLPDGWGDALLDEGDFFLDVDTRTVSYEPYL